MLLEIGLHFFIPKGFIHPLVAIVADIVLVLTGGDTVWTYEAVL